MYGWRARLGLLVPANNSVIEPELGGRLPAGAALYATRLIVEGPFEPESLHRMERQADRGIAELRLTQVDAIVYACLSTSLAKGPEWDEGFAARAGGLPCFTAARATAEALVALGARRVAFLSPYPAAIQGLVEPFFAALGLGSGGHASLDVADYHAVTRLGPEVVYRRARAMELGGADALCVLATDLRSLEAIAPLEAALGVPVVSTNQAILWRGLRACGVSTRVPGLGRLLEA